MTNPTLLDEARILIIDDTTSIHDDFRKILYYPQRPSIDLATLHAAIFNEKPAIEVGSRFQVDCVAQGADGVAKAGAALAASTPYAVAFVDMRMPPGWDGIRTTKELWAVDPAIQVVICSAYSDRTWEEMVTQLGRSDNLLILKKPFDNIEVLQFAHALSAKWEITRRDRERMADLDERVRQRTVELREAEGRFATIFQANPVAISLQTIPDGTFVDVNPAFLRLVKYERHHLVERPPLELNLWAESTVWPAILASLEQHAPLRGYQARLRTGAGSLRDVLVSVEGLRLGSQLCVLTSLEDITDRLLLEQKFHHAQKMEAVGQLAAGVAHDFNNVLTVIQSYTSVVLEDAQLDVSHREELEQVRAAADRAAALTRQLLIFTRRQITRQKPLNVGATMAQLHVLLRRLLPEHTALVCEYGPSLPTIVADEANLEQVIMNLVVNARDAMPDGGKISISARTVSVEASGTLRHPEARPGLYVELSVADTGTGMAPEVLAHIFEPFFTTKGVGKGTGLGLSTVYAIVHQLNGWIEVASAPDLGSKFDVFVPALDGVMEGADPVGNEPPKKPSLGSGERILLVEDEPSVRRATKTIMVRAGYQVQEADDPITALECWETASERFDLLVTDMVMPNGSGTQLSAELQSRDPSLKVIIMTGYSHDLLDSDACGPAAAQLLLKPFSVSDLLAAVRQSLERQP